MACADDSQAAKASAVQRLVPELWYRIFEELQSREGVSDDIKTVMKVCPSWKACATPLLFRHLLFKQEARLAKFVTLVVMSNLRGDSPGKWTRSLSIYGFAMGRKVWAVVPTLLMHLPNLQSFVSGLPTGPLELLEMNRTCGQDLRRLDIVLSGIATLRWDELGLEVVGKFNSLRELSISSLGPHELSPPPAAYRSSLCLPLVTTLSWSTSLRPSPWFIAFLSRSTFRTLRCCTLKLPSAEQADAVSLNQFLLRHTRQLRELKLDVPPGRELDVIGFAFGAVPTLARISFLGPVPSPVVALRLPFARDMHVCSRRRGDDLWPFLDGLAAVFPRYSSRTVSVAFSDGPFVWGALSVQDPTLAGKMLGAALKLATSKAHLVDDRNRTLGLYEIAPEK